MEERPITVAITDSNTGETRSLPATGDWERGKFSDWLWSEGNYACDCNRHIFFASVAGEDDSDRKCGDDRFRVRITDEGGAVVYEDDAPCHEASSLA